MNPLIRDEDVAFILYDVLDVASLTKLPYFAEHGRETFDPYLATVARFAAEYWIRTEVPRAMQLADLCLSGENSYGRVAPNQL